MSGLIQAMQILKTVFDKYAGKEGDKNTLTKAELADLLRAELGLGGSNKADVDKFFSALDNDSDGTVDFQEYITFVAALNCMMCSSK
uniref:ictacalcin-like n=1 Tax=Scatophagus argus TaxID=75038 RepID=UPI001ED7F45C|nr:ictacalcin-like [Scatophagus argus]